MTTIATVPETKEETCSVACPKRPLTTFIHQPCGKGMATLAILIDHTPVLRVGVTFWLPNTPFPKSKARSIAVSRALIKRTHQDGSTGYSRYSFTYTAPRNFMKLHELKAGVYEAFLHHLAAGHLQNDPRPDGHNGQHSYHTPTWAERFGKAELAKLAH